MQRTYSEILWGKNAKFLYLFLAAIILLFTCLGTREIWTQEHRWSDIVSAMFYYHDFLHPVLNGNDYYDKPLLSYWLIAGFSYLTYGLTIFTLRLPSALAGLLALWSIYRLGTQLKNKQLGLLAGWMLLTTFYFIFWARTSSADMLNMAGTLFAVAWYFETKKHTRFFDYCIFFLILAVTALCKGLIGPAIACIAIFPDLLTHQSWKKHLRFSLILALIPAAILYISPFLASAYFSKSGYHENGLLLVYRENILRYFQPFDHEGPLYTYFIYLPIYLLPWTFFFIPALFSLPSRFKTLSAKSKWIIWSLSLLFLFLTLSGSRRNYYVLPLVPFALLMTADWILAGEETLKRVITAGRFAVIFFLLFFFVFDAGQLFYYAGGGSEQFAKALKEQAIHIKPWSQWNIVLLDPESKLRFYLKLAPNLKNHTIPGNEREAQTLDHLLIVWPELKNLSQQKTTIFISRKQYEAQLKTLLKNYTVVEGKLGWGQRFIETDVNLPIAFIPRDLTPP